jgi:hypothetical protein
LFSIKCQLILIGKQLGDNRLGVNSAQAQPEKGMRLCAIR